MPSPEPRPLAAHFHFGPRTGGVGVFIDRVFTDERLPWRTVHLSAETLPPAGRYATFLSGVRLLATRPERVLFAHTLKAGLALAIVKLVRPGVTFVYVGHGVRYTQSSRPFARVRYATAEWIVCSLADRVIHLRSRDRRAGERLGPWGWRRKVAVIAPKLEPSCAA